MAEKLAPGGSTPYGSEDLDTIESSSEDGTEDELERLMLHKRAMRNYTNTDSTHNRRPSNGRPPPKKPEAPVPRTYAALAAAATVKAIYVGRSGNLRSQVPNGRHMPRTLCVHSREGAINVTALMGKLQEIALIPQQIGRLPKGDLEITFESQRDKERFLGLCFVHVPRWQWAPGLADPPAIWVRAFGKPKELSLEVIKRKFGSFGQVLFARENNHPGTSILNGIVTMKMVIQQPIPSFVHLGPYCLMVRHDRQPQTCRRCDSTGHLAATCSIKRCYNCGAHGHIKADCHEDSRCQGCGSTDHHIDQCDSSWAPEDDTDLNELPNGRNSTTSSDEELTPDTVANLPEANNSDVAATNFENQTDLDDPILTVEEAPLLGTIADTEPAAVAPDEPVNTPDMLPHEENGQQVKNWYDPPTPLSDGMNSSSALSSPLTLFNQGSVEAGAPAASKRSFQEDNVSDITAVRRPSTKKKSRGHSARQPTPS